MASTSPERHDDDDRWFTLTTLVQYSGLSLSTLQRGLRSRRNPLPHHTVRIGDNDRGRLLISKREFDAWVRGDRQDPTPEEPSDVDVSWIRRGFDK
jgi:hypothetical protein